MKYMTVLVYVSDPIGCWSILVYNPDLIWKTVVSVEYIAV